MKSHKRTTLILGGLIVLFSIITVCGLIYFKYQAAEVLSITENTREYTHHYAFICNDPSDSFYQAVYNAAEKEGMQNNDYVEFMGKNLNVSYSRAELLKIAIEAQVDGIILEANESSDMTNLIDRAVSAGIPVVTVGSDNTASMRQSYVGLGYYDLGAAYAKEILKYATDEKQRVMVLMESNAINSTQNILYSGIQDTLEKSGKSGYFTMETMLVNDSVPFQAEESIGGLLMDDGARPDLLVCLTELDTTCAYQALIDYNKVGKTKIFGFFADDSILSAVKRGILVSTVAVDTDQMGKFSVNMLDEYLEDGFANAYLPADVTFINADNIDEYLAEREKEAGDGK